MNGTGSRSGGRAVVFGGGGLVGTAWLFGLIAGLRDAGVDLAAADVVVGTSAGSIAGAMLTSGHDLAGYAELLPEPETTAEADKPAAPVGAPALPHVITETFAMITDGLLDPEEARRRVGALALDAPTVDERSHLDRIGTLMPAREWPATRLLVTTVDTATGERAVWDASRGAPLLHAVGASTAVPGVFPPITIAEGRHMDGGMWSGTNADLAAGADVLVIAEPLAHLFPREPLRQELAVADASTVVTIVPDTATITAFGADLMSRAAWRPAFRAGVRQGAETADELRAVWHTEPSPAKAEAASETIEA